jgi:hypothetical protein
MLISDAEQSELQVNTRLLLDEIAYKDPLLILYKYLRE